MTDPLPLKGWILLNIEDRGQSGGANCEYASCHQPIRYVYVLHHPDHSTPFHVGGVCVYSFIDKHHADEALSFFKTRWKQRKGYFYKTFNGIQVIVGPRRDGTWYVAFAPSVRSRSWQFADPSFTTAEGAQRWAMHYVCRALQPAAKEAA